VSWQTSKLSDVCEINIGRTPSRSDNSFWKDGTENWLSISDLSKNKEVSITKEKITVAAVKACNCKIVQPETVLLSFKLSVGKVGITKVQMYTNEAIAALPIKNETKLSKEFLIHALSNLDFSLGGDRAAKGFTLNKEKLKEIKIPLPPLLEQKRIAAILDKADELKRKREAAIAKLEQLAQSIFVEMFGDVATNNKGWKIERLGNVLDDLTDYHANGSYEVLRNNVELKDEPDYALMLRTTDLENKNFTDGVKYITEHAYNFLKKSQVYGGEIIINKIGSAGNVYLAPYFNKPVSLGMNSFLLRINQQAHSKFIYDALSTNYISANIRSKVQGAVTKTITKDAVRSIEIPLPPIELQHQYINVVNLLEMQKSKYEGYLSKLNQLFSSLQHQAFSGQL
jgi:type I restriction enzyme, S subunit